MVGRKDGGLITSYVDRGNQGTRAVSAARVDECHQSQYASAKFDGQTYQNPIHQTRESVPHHPTRCASLSCTTARQLQENFDSPYAGFRSTMP